MEIIPLGVGEAFAKTLDQTNFLIRPAEGAPFLLDCGHTAARSLHRLKVPFSTASAVVLSHLHADHIGGLEELGFSGYFGWGTRPILYVPENLLPFLWDQALQAGMGQRLRGADGSFFETGLDTYFEVRPIRSREPFRLGSVVLTPFPTPHTPGRPSWGFRLDDLATGRGALLTCDSRLHLRNLADFGSAAEVIFHDCQLAVSGDHIHAGLEELRTLPAFLQEKILLVHYADDWRDYLDRTGPMQFARQGHAYSF
jgi:ribonuclease BN (tRNA processing enzyme)